MRCLMLNELYSGDQPNVFSIKDIGHMDGLWQLPPFLGDFCDSSKWGNLDLTISCDHPGDSVYVGVPED